MAPPSPSESTNTTTNNKSKKRRRQPKRQSTRKRVKLTEIDGSSSQAEEFEVDSASEDAEEFAVRAILKEKKGKKGERFFYVDWADHPVTGESYPKEWKKEVDVGLPLVQAWDREQAGRKRKRVVESSPELPISSAPAATPAPAPRKSSRKKPSPLIRVETRTDFDREDYDPYSQLPATPQSAASARRSLISSHSSQYSGPKTYRSSGEVPDSEGEEDEAIASTQSIRGVDSWKVKSPEDCGSDSYVPTTQEGAVSTLTSTNSQALASPALSALSIPETEPDTIEDSQLELEQTQTQERQREIPNTFDSLDISISNSEPPAPSSPAQSPPATSPPAPSPPAPEPEIQESGFEPEIRSSAAVDSDIEVDTGVAENEVEVTREAAEVITADAGITDQTAITGGDAAQNNTTHDTTDTAEVNTELESDSVDHTTILDDESAIPAAEAEKESSEVNIELAPAPAAPQEETLEDSVERRNFAASNAIEVETEVESFVQLSEQYAQRVPASTCSTTQNDSAILVPGTESPQSRHDSSQESPVSVSILTVSSSPLALPPPQSLNTLDSRAPPRPRTPFRFSNMMDTQKEVENTIEGGRELTPASQLKKPSKLFPQLNRAPGSRSPPVPSQPGKPSKLFPQLNRAPGSRSPPVPSQPGKPSNLFPQLNRPPGSRSSPAPSQPAKPSKLFPQLNRPPTIRSPSTIPPERSPAPQTSPSLLTVAVPNTAEVEAAGTTPAPAPEPEPEPEPEREQGSSEDSEQHAPASSPAAMSVDNDVLSDSGSLFNDDLDLEQEEFIVPLPMDGRQAKIYSDELHNKASKINAFLKNYRHQPPQDVERIMYRLQSIETHVDILYADPFSQASLSQYEHHTQWSCDNSVKFRFIRALCDKLREQEMHVILVLEKDHDEPFKIVESFFHGMFINFKSPIRGVQADMSRVRGELLVTVLSSNSDALVQPPDVIICLDGYTGRIRAKNWSRNPVKPTVPILHLVIPRAIAHIDRYVSTSTNSRRRLHTILATLGQYHAGGEVGTPVHPTPKAVDAADAVAEFLLSPDDASASDWALPPIGSIKDEVEFASQQSLAQESPSPVHAAKRPLELEDGNEAAKRLRLTPQPPNEVSHVSDSMPGTAAYQRERALRLEQEKQFNEERMRWDARQTTHEDLSRSWNSIKKAKETAERREALVRERLNAKTTECQEWQTKFKELQESLLMSDDAKVAEIARLRKEVNTAKESEARALKNKRSTEDTLEYIKDQYASSQDSATQALAENEALRKRLAIAERKASGQVNELAKLHYEAVKERDARVESQHAAQNKVLIKQLQAAEEANSKLKAGRNIGVGTRAQSVGVGGASRTRPGSRAASPSVSNGNGNGRDRVTNLRNG